MSMPKRTGATADRRNWTGDLQERPETDIMVSDIAAFDRKTVYRTKATQVEGTP